jgi:hypothetical protein
MLLATITAAMLVISALLYGTSLVGSEFRKASARAARYVGTSITFVDAYVNSTSGCHHVYLKNTGSYPITSVNSSSVMIGNTTSLYLVSYAGYNISNPGPGYWSFIDIEKPNEIWDKSETLKLIVCPPAVLTSPYKLVIGLPEGVTYTWIYG